MAFQPRLQQYECDLALCRKLIPKSQPVIFADGKHFCSPECYRKYLDKVEEDRRWQETSEYTAYMSDN